jgi:hypothetical protein
VGEGVAVAASFIEARFVGERFAGGKLPLSVVGELEALNKLLFELARERYLSDHPDRKRLPRGFRATTALQISAVANGSAIVTLERPTVDSGASDVTADHFEKASEVLLRAISAAGSELDLPSEFPTWARARCNMIGRSLAPDEHLLLTSTRSRFQARYDRKVRKALVGEANEFEDDFSVVGSVHAFDADALSFGVTSADGPVNGNYVPQLDEDLRTALAAGKPGGRYLDGNAPFHISGTARFKRSSMVTFRAESIERVDFEQGVVSFGEIVKRVVQITALDAGWLHGEGEPVTSEIAERFLTVVAQLAYRGRPSPSVFPTAEGGLRAEWSGDGTEYLWELEASGACYYLQGQAGTSKFVEGSLGSELSAADVAEQLDMRLTGLWDDSVA